MPDDAQRDGRQRRSENDFGRIGDALRDRDRPETRDQRQHQRGESDDRCRRDHHQTFSSGRVDHCTGRRLRNDAGDGRNRHHHADMSLVPVLLGEQIDCEIRPKSLADVGEEEVRGIEGVACAPLFISIRGHD